MKRASKPQQLPLRFSIGQTANDALVIFLISGGGSAMIEWPVSEDISLSDLRFANQELVSCGASIAEMNSVRRGFSAVKGGALARRSPAARLFTLIVSDTNPGDEASVASGPTLAPGLDSPEAMEVVEEISARIQFCRNRSRRCCVEQNYPTKGLTDLIKFSLTT